MQNITRIFILFSAIALAACGDREAKLAELRAERQADIALMLPLCLQFHSRGVAPSGPQMANAGFEPYSVVGNNVVSVGNTSIDYRNEDGRGMAFRGSCTMYIPIGAAIASYANAIQASLIEQGYSETPSPRPRSLAVKKGNTILTIGGFADRYRTTVWIGKI